MIELRWFQAYPPRSASLADVTGLVRVLAGRPRLGLRRLQPIVVFEVWLYPDQVRWLIGTEPSIARTLPAELASQLSGLVLTSAERPQRPVPITAREIRTTSMIYPLRRDTASGVVAALMQTRTNLHRGEAMVVQWVVGPCQTFTEVPVRRTVLDVLGWTPAREPDGDERTAWKAKLSEPLLGVRGRVGAVAGDLRRAGELLRPVVSALGLAGGAHARVYGSQQSRHIADQLTGVMGRMRSWSGQLNASELATLMAWSVGGLDVPGTASAFAQPPVRLLETASRPGGRPLGVSTHPANLGKPVRLPLSSYSVHTQVVGPSGSGKSTLLVSWILSEIAAGRSVVVIEPKGDLIRDSLARMPQDVSVDVVVIDPGADGPVVGFNPLAGHRDDAERRADSLLHLMREVFGSAIGPRSADVLLHALVMAARLKDGALTDAPTILTNPRFRRWAAAKVSDPLTIGPWLGWFDSLSDGERIQVVAPVTNKLRPWTARPSIRRLLGVPKPQFDLSSVFQRPTALFVNLNAGAMGPEAVRLVGSLLLNQLWEAIQRQTTLPAHQRRTVSVIVDEFQAFTAGLDFADVLARARGANAPFTLAHQHLDQMSTELRAAVLANVGSRVVFRPAEGDDRTLARVLGDPVTPDDLERLDAYHAACRVLVDGAPSNTFEVATSPLPPAVRDPEAIRRASAERFGQDPVAIDAALVARWNGTGDTPPDALTGGVRRRSS
jgi:hypothetical protein